MYETDASWLHKYRRYNSGRVMASNPVGEGLLLRASPAAAGAICVLQPWPSTVPPYQPCCLNLCYGRLFVSRPASIGNARPAVHLQQVLHDVPVVHD